MSLIIPETGLTIWMFIIFALVFLLLSKFAFPVITRSVEQRTESINKALFEAEKAKKYCEELTLQQEKIIEQARIERNRILKEANKDSERIIQEAKNKASEEAKRLIEQAELQIQAKNEAFLERSKEKIAILSLSIAEKVIKKELSDLSSEETFFGAMLDEFSELDKMKQRS